MKLMPHLCPRKGKGKEKELSRGFLLACTLSVAATIGLVFFKSGCVPAKLSDSFKSTAWHASELPTASSVLYTVSSTDANFGRERSADDTLVVIVARDLFIGCHSWEEYTSPNFETLFVFDQRFATVWEMQEMILQMDRSTTLGSHLVVADGSIGEQSARRIALNLVQRFEHKPSLLFSCNCDIHPLPKEHAYYMSFPEITRKLSTDFKRERQLRASGEGAYVQGFNVTKEFNPLYAMNFLLYERFKNMKGLRAHADAQPHGKDLYLWLRNLQELGKPREMVEAGHPWVSPVNEFVESHAVMYDREKMEDVGQDMFISDCVPSETHAVGQFALRRGWSVVRNNEVYMHFDLSTMETSLEHPRYSALNESEMEWMKLLNWELIAKRRNPRLGCALAKTFESKGIRMAAFYGTGFTRKIYRDHWAPNRIQNSPAGAEWVQRWIDASMLTAGYAKSTDADEAGLVTYVAEGCYPGTVPMFSERSANQNVISQDPDAHEFLRFNTDGRTMSLMTWHPFDGDELVIGPDYPKQRRSITLPLTNLTTLERASTPLSSGHKWAFFHIHGEWCTDRVNTFND